MKARTADAIFVPLSDEDTDCSRFLFANGVYSLLERGGALVDSDSNLVITYDVV